MRTLLEQWVASLRETEHREQLAGELLDAIESGAETRPLEQELGVDGALVRDAAAPISSERRARWVLGVLAAEGAGLASPERNGKGEGRFVSDAQGLPPLASSDPAPRATSSAGALATAGPNSASAGSAGPTTSIYPSQIGNRKPSEGTVGWRATAGGLAMAAALAMWVLTRPAGPPPAEGPATGVTYQLSLPEADARWRSTPAAPSAGTEAVGPVPNRAEREPHYTLGRELEFTLRPSTRTTEARRVVVSARALAAQGETRWQQLNAAITRLPGGAMQLRVATDRAPFAIGHWELRLVVEGGGEMKGRFALGRPR